MSAIDMEFNGLDELLSSISRITDENEIKKVNKQALKDCSNLAKGVLQGTLLRSSDPRKSGRKGSRTGKHSADNIPVTFKTKNGVQCVYVGWEKDDTSPYYYTKMVDEWGSSKHRPLFIFKKTFIKQRKKYDEIFKEYYEQLLEQLLED